MTEGQDVRTPLDGVRQDGESHTGGVVEDGPLPVFAETGDVVAGGVDRNRGHGHVFPRPDRRRAKCGGPGICGECGQDAAIKAWTDSEREAAVAHERGKGDVLRSLLVRATGNAPQGLQDEILRALDTAVLPAAPERPETPRPIDGWRDVIFGRGRAIAGWTDSGRFVLWGSAEDLADAVLAEWRRPDPLDPVRDRVAAMEEGLSAASAALGDLRGLL